jgi:hypothetical protein
VSGVLLSAFAVLSFVTALCWAVASVVLAIRCDRLEKLVQS